MKVARALPRPCPACGDVAAGVFCPHDGAPLAGSFSIGGDRYLVDELIGQGAMAIVFGGRHRTLSRAVAVKILRPEVAQDAEQQQRFLREARAASRLNHENIVGVLDFGWDDHLGVTYMVMERLFGKTLANELEESGRISWQAAVPLLVQICRALDAAHGRGIVHRDLTSRNVLLVANSGRRVVKLCDFGLSRQTTGGDRVTHNGAWVGTPAYMAPEQLDTGPLVQASADLYSLGVLAHEILTGCLPVEASSVVEMVTSKLIDDLPRISVRFPDLRIPEELDSLIARCLERDPTCRPTAAELERALLRLAPRALDVAIEAEANSGSLLATRDDAEPTMIGSYRVVKSLGTGGTGRVYLGEHPVIGSKVAIKVLLPEIAGSRETVERFIQEARTSSQIDSPHIPRYYDFGRTAGGLPYAVMEYFEGETLAAHIERVGSLSVAESADILGQVASALTLAHEAGLVHRDLKPDNIFLVAAEGKSGRPSSDSSGPALPLPGSGFHVKVLDFGIAKAFGKDSGTRTQQGYFLGTPFYCAPEQVFGAEVDPRADVYGLGATAFEMLTGMPPFVGEVSEVLEAKTCRDAPLLRSHRPDLSALVEHTVARMLARDAQVRAGSMIWVREQVATWTTAIDQDDVFLPDGAAAPHSGATKGNARSSSGSRAEMQSSSVSTAKAAIDLPVLDAPLARRSSSVYDDAAFESLETIMLSPGSRGTPELVRRPAMWRRPRAMVIAASAAAVALALAYLASNDRVVVSASSPVVTPIESNNATSLPPVAAERAQPMGRDHSQDYAAKTVSSPAPAAADQPSVATPRHGKPSSTKPGKGPRPPGRPGSRHLDKPHTDASSVAKDPEPPRDVIIADPFKQ